ncbi:MAG: polymer-forming cytoskeletal protein [Phycisphaerae bacterium]
MIAPVLPSLTMVPTVVKRVCCTHCQRITQVGPRALSVVCPHCNQRLVIEDVRVESFYAVREIATCGDVVVEKRGHVVASIRAGNLIVDGKVHGDVIALGRVSISRTASVTGDIKAARLLVQNGAALEGFLRIGDLAAPPPNDLALPAGQPTP